MSDEKKGAISALYKLFKGGKSSDANEYGAGYITGGTNTVVSVSSSRWYAAAMGKDEAANMTCSGGDMLEEAKLPLERFAKYTFLEEMSRFSILNDALDIHLTHALSTDKKTNRSFVIQGKEGKTEKETAANRAVATELMNALGETLNREMPAWAKIMCVYGVTYVRPYAQTNVGIVSFENSYYTNPYFVREYVRGNDLAGFTNEYFWGASEKANLLAEPWALIPLKIPFWTPDRSQEPINIGLTPYALMDDPMERLPSETQNYGTSMLEHSYGAYQSLLNALKSLKASRNNASKIDRLIGVNTSTLDPVNAAAYINTITASFKRSADRMARRAQNGGYIPTVVNNVIPVMGDGKGTMSIDTQSTTADISNIEDIMFYLRQLAGSVGMDVTLLGWADIMSGGLGEGGFFRTSIQAAMRAQWIRNAVYTFTHRAIDIHLAYKSGKVYLPEDRPYTITFNSLNTAIQEEEMAEQESRSNYASVVVSILDAIQNSEKLSNSPTFMRLLCDDLLKFGNEVTDRLIKELNGPTQEEDEALFESLMRMPPARRAALIEQSINSVLSEEN